MKKKGICTIGISEERVVKSGGILPLLLKSGVKKLDRLVESQCINTATGQPRFKTKYGIVRHYHKTQFDTMKNGRTVLEEIDLADYLEEKKKYQLPLNGSPRTLVLIYNEHTFELTKKGRNCYRLKTIDNKSVLDFTEEKMIQILDATPFFDLLCDIKTTRQAVKTMNCTPRKKIPNRF